MAETLPILPTIAAAIDYLRPLFAENDQKRVFMSNLPYGTYFATIPRDIYHIIFDMLPNMRQTFTEQAFVPAYVSYREFMNNYRFRHSTDVGIYDEKVLVYDVFIPSLDKYKICADFAQLGKRGRTRTDCCGKMGMLHELEDKFNINRTQEFAIGRLDIILSHEYIFGGTTRWEFVIIKHRFSPNEERLTIPITLQLDWKLSCDIQIWKLPCGLVVIQMTDKLYVMDPEPYLGMDSQPPILVQILGEQATTIKEKTLIDDYGQITEYSVSLPIYNWSDLTCEYVKMFMTDGIYSVG